MWVGGKEARARACAWVPRAYLSTVCVHAYVRVCACTCDYPAHILHPRKSDPSLWLFAALDVVIMLLVLTILPGPAKKLF